MLRFIGFFLLAIIVLGASFQYQPKAYVFPELSLFPKMPSSATNMVTVEGVDLGRHLFYDTILSLNFDKSCGSCHKQEVAFSDAPNKFTIGNNGHITARNTLPLFNLAWYPAYFWDGRAASLEEQVFHPVRDSNEMNLNWVMAVERLRKSKFYKLKFKAAFGEQKIDSVLITKSIGQFLRTLISHQSKFDSVMGGQAYLSKDEYDGMVLMNDMTKGDCLHCHLTDGDALTTNANFSNNGLDAITNALQYVDKGRGLVTGKVTDNGKFKTPSLRNIALTAPYMHDGRFATLEDVLDFYSEGVKLSANVDSKMGHAAHGGMKLSTEEQRKIIAFLHTFTDSVFISNPQFANPFR